MKKSIAIILSVLMLFSMLPIASAEADTLEERTYPCYIGSLDNSVEATLAFLNGVDDLPYIDMETWGSILYVVCAYALGNEDFDLSYEMDGSTLVLTRENGYDMTIDANEDTISFTDYNRFLSFDSEDSMLIEILSSSGYNENGESSLFQRNRKASFDRYGDAKTIYLADYGIDAFIVEDEFYLPLQTLNDIIFSPALSVSILFNGEGLYVASGDSFEGDGEYGRNDYGVSYHSVEPHAISEELASFNYRELCLAFDTVYGLKEPHDIKNFSQTFWEIGFDEPLSSTNTADSDLAIHQFLNYYLDDQHSTYTSISPYSEIDSLDAHSEIVSGTATHIMDKHMERYADAREKVMGENIMPYQEVGNTAYIMFDGFEMNFEPEDYYAFGLDDDAPMPDTIGLVIYAHHQITRENSPIENVVIDLSNNTGGVADAAVFVLSWVLGESTISLKDSFTGAMSNGVYRADVNLDREFDAKDTLENKNVFCLISPVSFSCGNLVPAALKASQVVTLLGTKSGGGSCVVQPMSSATGSLFNISGQHRLSFLKNGSFYDIDEGVDPDFAIKDISHYYDREALTEYINNLF